jgi:hypothetical protein
MLKINKFKFKNNTKWMCYFTAHTDTDTHQLSTKAKVFLPWNIVIDFTELKLQLHKLQFNVTKQGDFN